MGIDGKNRSSIIMNALLILATLAAAVAATSATECGKRFYDQHLDHMQQWIVGGVTALKGGYPYQVSFEYKDWFTHQHICGATIVSDKWVITAAHCIIDGPRASSYKVVVGRYSLNKFSGATRRLSIKRVIVHPKWVGDYEDEMSNDIALLELKTPITFNEFVQPACLPDNISSNPSGLYKPGTMTLISGWGEMDPKSPTQDEPGRSPVIMRAASVPLIDWNKCANANSIYKEMLTETMTCAGYMEGGIDGCQGDSGGPLVSVVNGKATLIGVVSWGIGCAHPKNPGIYTNVAYELPWIRQYIK